MGTKFKIGFLKQPARMAGLRTRKGATLLFSIFVFGWFLCHTQSLDIPKFASSYNLQKSNRRVISYEKLLMDRDLTDDQQFTKTAFKNYLSKSIENKYCKMGYNRYEVPLRYREVIENLGDKKILFAANLFNNAEIMPQFIINVMSLIKVFGKDRIIFTLFENGSSDGTEAHLLTLQRMLDEEGVENYVTCDDEYAPLTVNDHRIEYLAKVRNEVLRPFYGMNQGEKDKIAHIVFSNDIYYCVEDVLELLLNANHYEADVTCAHDYIPVGPKKKMGFYDIWVTRDIDGNICDNEGPNDPPCFHSASFHRYKKNWAYQSHACWGGMVVLNPEMFKKNIKFRSTCFEEDKQMEQVLDVPFYPGCDASEINALFKDLREIGHSRAVAVPAVKVAYVQAEYEQLRKEWTHNLKPSLYKKFDLHQMVRFQYKDVPKALYCHPIKEGTLNGKALEWSPEGIEPVPKSERHVPTLDRFTRN